MDKTICVIAEVSTGRLQPVTDEAIAFARRLRAITALEIRVVVPEGSDTGAALTLASATGLSVTVITGRAIAAYSAEIRIAALTPVLEALNPAYICIPHTATGGDYAPALAVRLKAACITAVEGCRGETEGVVFTRSLCKGKLKMDLVPTVGACVLTILPGVIGTDSEPINETEHTLSDKTGSRVTMTPFDAPPTRSRPLGRIPAPETDLNLDEAEVIVAAGKGIGQEENLTLIQRLAAVFPKGAVGASRLVCDAGWLPYPHQVGITGKTVAPKLYIACGISGTIQHVSGMRGSRCIVAVNKDPRAAIFQVAHYGIVADLTTFIPLLLDLHEGLCPT